MSVEPRLRCFHGRYLDIGLTLLLTLKPFSQNYSTVPLKTGLDPRRLNFS